MGKSPDDLPLDPLSHTRPLREDHEATDIRSTAWYQFVGEIDDLLESDRFVWAVDTLTGIKETVERTKHVTEGQRRAVGNIAAARERSDGWRRRYEGRR